MTVSEAMKRLAELPPDAVLCYMRDDIHGFAVEISQVDLTSGTWDGDEYRVRVDGSGDKRIAVVA